MNEKEFIKDVLYWFELNYFKHVDIDNRYMVQMVGATRDDSKVIISYSYYDRNMENISYDGIPESNGPFYDKFQVENKTIFGKK